MQSRKCAPQPFQAALAAVTHWFHWSEATNPRSGKQYANGLLFYMEMIYIHLLRAGHQNHTKCVSYTPPYDVLVFVSRGFTGKKTTNRQAFRSHFFFSIVASRSGASSHLKLSKKKNARNIRVLRANLPKPEKRKHLATSQRQPTSCGSIAINNTSRVSCVQNRIRCGLQNQLKQATEFRMMDVYHTKQQQKSRCLP